VVRTRSNLVLLCLLIAPLSCFGSDWTQPTSEELKMTSDPAAPDAPAVYLFREEKMNDRMHDLTIYARIKILTEKGKEMFADIEIPYLQSDSKITDIAARTIHPDGTVIPFTAKPMEKLVIKTGDHKVMEKVFTMPDVQVGSILEYRCRLQYYGALPARWYLAKSVFVHKAHYYFYPGQPSMYSWSLPAGVHVTETKEGGYDLVVENISALPDEDYMPPFKSFSFRVNFYYFSSLRTSDEYWKELGKYWSKDEVDRFANPSGKIRSAVGQIVASGDSDEKKVEKIYDEVMKIENTSFTRTRSAAESKAQHLKDRSAEDIWKQRQGTSNEINGLFIAMVRAAGLKAYAMIVVNRDQNMFQPLYLDWDQLNDELTIVVIGGKEIYFDPGQRYCEFGKLHWKHTWVQGVRQADNGTQIATTPGLTYQDNHVDRYADLTLDQDGKVHGVIRINMTGTMALTWRQAVLSSDQDEMKREFDHELRERMSPGVEVKTNHFVALTDYKHPLMVVVDVSGSFGTSTGKRVFVPAAFFEGGAKPLFAQERRESAVDLHYPYTEQDQFSMTLPPNLTPESVPKESRVIFGSNAQYVAKFVIKGNTYTYGRLVELANAFYTVTEYPQLRGFYQKTNAEDQAQLVLLNHPTPVGAATLEGNSK
jgi:hypothetical protein